MKITKLTLKNYKGFKTLDLKFDGQLNLFVGVNGAGKSTVLEALKLSLSWLVNRISREKANGQQLPKADIHNGSRDAVISLSAQYRNLESTSYNWTLTQSNLPTKEEASYKEVTLLAKQIWQTYKNEASLPVIQVYPVSRVVEQISPETIKEGVSDLAIYDNALTGKTNYQSFFEWFRYKDDILNERILNSKIVLSESSKNFMITQLTKIKKLDEKLNLNTAHLYEHAIMKLKHDKKSDIENILLKLLLNDRNLSNSIVYIFYLTNTSSHFNKADVFNQTSLTIKILNDEFKSIQESNERIYNMSMLSILIFIYLGRVNSKHQEEMNLLLESLSENDVSVFPEELIKILERDLNEPENENKSINQGKELKFVRQAIELFIPEYQNLQVKREPEPRMELTKNGQIFNLNQLSDGEKNLIALIGDIARRLTMANPSLENPLHGEGIIIIDEIDMHLHPKWQRILSEKLTEVFPNCQFFLSTHSPQVVSHVQEQSVIGLENVDGEIKTFTVNDPYGKNSDRILEDIMNVSSRPQVIQNKLDAIFDLISADKLEDAQEKILLLKKEMGEDGELTKASTIIKRKKMIGR